MLHVYSFPSDVSSRANGKDIATQFVHLRNVQTHPLVKDIKLHIAVSLVLRASDRTLTDVEVQNGTELLLKMLSDRLGAEIR